MTKRAVLYARVSSDDRGKDGRNLEGQLDLCRQYAQDQGWNIVAELAEDDRGASGAELDLPQLGRAREMARKGQFDVLVVRELDRLSRRLAKQLIVERELENNGVKIQYALGNYADTLEGKLAKDVRAVIAEYERLKIAERTKRARRNIVKNGGVIVHGRPPYGYRLDRSDGKRELVVVESEARVVKMIFDWYTQGDPVGNPLSIKAITRRLTELGIPTKGDINDLVYKVQPRGVWHTSSVGCILNNEVYIGVWAYGKRKRVDGELVEQPEDQWIYVDVPAIISRETWETVQERREQNKRRAKHKYDYLLSTRVTCGECGGKMRCCPTHSSGKVYLYYRCPGSRGRRVKPCTAPSFRVDGEDGVDAVVWNWVQTLFMDTGRLREGLKAQQEQRDQENQPLRDRLDIVEDLLAKEKARMDRLLELYLDGTWEKDFFKQREAELRETTESLEQERDGLNTQLEAQTITEDQIREIEEFAQEIGNGLSRAERNFNEKRRLISLLDVQATLVEEEGEKIVYVRCLLDGKKFWRLSNTTQK